jgi:hypothetical protein
MAFMEIIIIIVITFHLFIKKHLPNNLIIIINIDIAIAIVTITQNSTKRVKI